MSRLVVVSNRVADLKDAAQTGGLAVAMLDALTGQGGMWFGWDGKTVPPGTRVPPHVEEVSGIRTVTLPLTQKDYREYYAGFSNSVLWPLLHYRLDLMEFESADLRGYKRVNSKFAEALSPLLRASDVVWIHDYHLIPLGAELRRHGHRQRMGFFLHIPFCPPEILAAAPEHEWLVRALFAYDLVGFQTRTDLGNFRRYVEEQCGGKVDEDGTARAFGETTRLGCFPIGIDVDSFAKMAHSAEARAQIGLLRKRSLERRQIIGVDRLDYSKGLPDRLRAFGRLLELYPENLKTVSMMQIAPPTREDVEAYADIREELEALSGSINGRFADFDWTPVRYIHRAVPRATLAALFRASDVGLVSPLRDGMNLVAKEFVAAQDEKDPGVLVLSKFAGAAEELEEALIVNPYDIDEMAENLQRALTMPLDERRTRYRALIERIRAHDVHAWYREFLDALADAPRTERTARAGRG
ncbi:MAG TPA: trehalose-6-phosphate synthase [Thermohalobaculum sp.]|nr:trehalose-6-phosphate synthase [Thermohalobaculum sp.]